MGAEVSQTDRILLVVGRDGVEDALINGLALGRAGRAYPAVEGVAVVLYQLVERLVLFGGG